MLQLKQVAFLFLLFTILSTALLAQSEQENSPYSFFGPGDLKNTLIAKQKAMGGVGIASSAVQYVNQSNPAALGNLRFATLHTGIFANRHWLRNSNSSTDEIYNNESFNASMDYLMIGLPITKWWGSSISLLPYASTSYDLERRVENTTLTDSINTEIFNFRGTGGYYQFQWANGFATPLQKEGFFKTNQLALGIQSNFYFGNRDQTTIIQKPFLTNSLDVRETQSLKLNDFGFKTGIQYAKYFYKNVSTDPQITKEEINRILTIGASFNAKTNINSKRDYVLESILYDAVGNANIIDTIGEFLDRENIGVILPLQFGVGINYKKPGIWEIEANYEKTNWSAYDDGRINNLNDAYRLSAGISVKPIRTNAVLNNRLRALNYYFGGYYYSNHIQINESITPDFGLTFGFGLPLYNNLKFKRLANMNISLNVGSRGNTLENNVRETYFKANFGFTFNDGNWFIKRKYE